MGTDKSQVALNYSLGHPPCPDLIGHLKNTFYICETKETYIKISSVPCKDVFLPAGWGSVWWVVARLNMERQEMIVSCSIETYMIEVFRVVDSRDGERIVDGLEI